LLASGQIVMRKIDGWNTLSTVSSDQQQGASNNWRLRRAVRISFVRT
jgi:hypothetical protein